MTATRTASILSDAIAWEPAMGFGVTVDTREQAPWHFDQLVPIHVAALPAGDYSVAGHEAEIAIERKNLEDFVHSAVVEYADRFGRELDRLASYSFAAIVVEADVGAVHRHAYRSRVSPAAVLSRAATITATRRIPVLFGGSAKHAADLGLRLLRQWAKHRAGGAS